jgi:DNA-binding transcriptional MerR regulator
VEALWTLPELVAEVTARITALPAPKNGQVRAIPDERTVRYYMTLGLLDRPSATRGRTALYGHRHVAQVVAIKRLQTLGRSLSEIQALWPTLDDQALTRMSGVMTTGETARPQFWRHEALPPVSDKRTAINPTSDVPEATRLHAPALVELRVELAPRVVLSLMATDDHVTVSPADVCAIRAASAPLLAELALRRLAADPDPGEDE